jgi:hypothetical protein
VDGQRSNVRTKDRSFDLDGRLPARPGTAQGILLRGPAGARALGGGAPLRGLNITAKIPSQITDAGVKSLNAVAAASEGAAAETAAASHENLRRASAPAAPVSPVLVYTGGGSEAPASPVCIPTAGGSDASARLLGRAASAPSLRPKRKSSRREFHAPQVPPSPSPPVLV